MSWENRYSRLERLIHQLAFATWPIQAAVADIEGRIFEKELAETDASRPVFVAGLPRAGTTLLLELLESTGAFASSRYRDMPFLLTPLLWEQFTRKAGSQAPLRMERAHGDGVLIGADSPEAFEEVIWRTFFPERYRSDHLGVWPGATDPDFGVFFRRHMQKMIALRRRENQSVNRYLSKNNGNIARLDAIYRLFPDATVIVPFRSPVEQALSLLEKHQLFLSLHEDDPFVAKYMAAIGHYDFGANFKPIDFDGWLCGLDASCFLSINTWIEYWTAAYGYLLARDDLALTFVSFDELCSAPNGVLTALDAVLETPPRQGLAKGSGRVSPPRPRLVAAGDIDPVLLDKARAVHRGLEAAAVRLEEAA